MKNLLILSAFILLISCNSKSQQKDVVEAGITILADGSKVESAVEAIPEKVEDAVETIEKPSEVQKTMDNNQEVFKRLPFITKILEQLGVQPLQVYEGFVVQKVLPYDTTSTVVVIPTIANLEYDGDVFVLNSYVLVVDSETAAIKHQFYEPESWYSDAIRLTEVSIDTANYRLADGKRAFGISLYYIGASRPNPYSSTTLSLFIQENDKLVRVLNSFETQSHWGEWDMQCTGEFIDVKKILIIDTKSSEGYYDMSVSVETTTMDTFEKGEDDCDEKKATQKSKQLLRYTNGSYQLHKKTYTLETDSRCKLMLTLQDDQYYLKTTKREHSGKFVIKDGSIIFKGLLTDEPKVEVQGAYYNDVIEIQNYGNAMNSFTVFGECGDQKFLRLVKEE
ncbi:PA3715 family protein [Aquimarina sp. M1]